jgi:hypothetical protein
MNALGRVVLVLGALALAGTSACKKEPDLATVHRRAGDEHFLKGEFKQAAEKYGLSLEADPKQEKVWDKKAVAQQQSGDMAGLEITLVKMAESKPDAAQKAEMYRSLASMFMTKATAEKGDAAKANAEKAEKYFNEAVKVFPQDDVSLAWLGEIYAQRGGARDMAADAAPEHLEKAMAYYDKVIAIKPELPATYINKRIVIKKYMTKTERLKQAAEQEAKTNKDKDKAEAAKKEIEQHQARLDEFKKQFDELSKQFTEKQKAAAAAASAAAAAGTAAATAAPKPPQ